MTFNADETIRLLVVFDIVQIAVNVLFAFWVLVPMTRRLRSTDETITKVAAMATTRIFESVNQKNDAEEVMEEDTFFDWQDTYNAVLTGLYADRDDDWNFDSGVGDFHRVASRAADQAHGPCLKRSR